MNKFKLRKTIKSAEEAIPKPILDKFKDDHTSYYDQSFDKKLYKRSLKKFGGIFSRYGIDLNSLDLDNYLIEGVTLESFPRGCITILLLRDGHLVIKDKRDLSTIKDPLKREVIGSTLKDNKSIWDYEGGNRFSRLHRDRDQKSVRATKIPDSQLLSDAKYTWVIPEEEITDVSEKTRDRANNPIPSNYIRNSEFSIDPDKSGYDIGEARRDLRRRLEKYKLEKWEVEGYSKSANTRITEFYEKFNKLLKEIEEYSSISNLGKRVTTESRIRYSNIMRKVSQFFYTDFYRMETVLNRLEDSYNELVDSENSHNDLADLEKESDTRVGQTYIKVIFRKFLERLSEANRLMDQFRENQLSELRDAYNQLEVFSNSDPSVTESLKGQSYSTKLDVKDYYVSKAIFEALEED